MRAIRSRSSTSETEAGGRSFGVVDGSGFTDDGHLDLAGVLELVFDPPRDVLRQPDRLLVGDLLALDHDANLAAGLQRERLRHALEGVGNAFEFFEALDVGLEDVATGAWPRGG